VGYKTYAKEKHEAAYTVQETMWSLTFAVTVIVVCETTILERVDVIPGWVGVVFHPMGTPASFMKTDFFHALLRHRPILCNSPLWIEASIRVVTTGSCRDNESRKDQEESHFSRGGIGGGNQKSEIQLLRDVVYSCTRSSVPVLLAGQRFVCDGGRSS